MILSVCLNPVIQRTLYFDRIQKDEVNRASEQYVTASGKGVNVVRVLRQLGSEYSHITHAGGTQKEYFLQLCAQDSVKINYCDSSSEIRTCVTAVDLETRQVTELVEEAPPVNEGTASRIMDLFEILLRPASIVVISGTKAPGYPDDFFPEMVRKSKEEGKTVILDIKGEDLIGSLKYSPDWIKPNLYEFLSTFLPNWVARGEKIIPPEAVEAAIEKAVYISSRYRTGIILTQGSLGTKVIYKNEPLHFPAQVTAALNTTGCGDAFTAAFAHSLYGESSALSISDAVDFAQKCAAKNAVTKKPGSLY